MSVFRAVGRRQSARLLAQFGSRRGSAPGPRVLRCLLEGMRNVGIRSVGRESEVAGALVRVGDELCETPVELAAPDRVKAPVRGRGEQRVGEADVVVLELDHLGVERGSECVLSVGGRSGEKPDRRL